MVTININTLDGTNQITTNKVTGELKSVVLSLMDQKLSKVKVRIESEFGYTLLDYADLSETIYMQLAPQKIDKFAHLTPEWGAYYLNEKLKIIVSGAKNQDVRIILRIV